MKPTRDDSSWRRIAIGSFVTLLAVALAFNAAALVIDSSGLERGDSWPMVFGSVIITLLFGSTPLVLSLVAAVAAGPGTPGMARPCAWFCAGTAALCSAGLLLAAGVLVSGPPAEAAFGAPASCSPWCSWHRVLSVFAWPAAIGLEGSRAMHQALNPNGKLGCPPRPTHLGSSGASRDPCHRPA